MDLFPVVNVLVQSLTQILQENYELISGLDNQVKKLRSDINYFMAVLKELGKTRTASEVEKKLVNDIREVVHNAEDLFDRYVVEAKMHAGKLSSIRDLRKKMNVAENIKSILDEIQRIRDEETYKKLIDDRFSMHNRNQSEQQKEPIVEEEYVVGFDGEAKTIIDRLRGGSEGQDVISVVGMPGLGKTTLANKVFKHDDIEYHFMYRAWLFVSKSYKRRDIFLRLLKILHGNQNYSNDTSDDALAHNIQQILGEHKYLIVLDDIWETDAFKELQIAFPKNKGSRILITTRKIEVAKKLNTNGNPHNLKYLEDNESWELLQRKVFRGDSCPSELEGHGMEIARKCGGLPLAVVMIAGILLCKSGEEQEEEWYKVSIGFSAFLGMNIEFYERIVRMSYDELSYDLKSCFLYLAAFPQGNEIPVVKLIRLWIAEGFIEEVGQLSMEQMAYEKLGNLLNRNLVMATQRKPNGQIKTCRVHDMLHEFCKKEAKADFVFNEISESNMQDQLGRCRRLSIKCDISEFVHLEPKSGEHVRSLLCFAQNNVEMIPDYISKLRKAFPLLKVFHFAADKSVLLTRFPKDFTMLFHLRYVAVTSNLSILPKPIENLRNVQTLIVKTTQNSLEIKGDIWSMSRLRHMETDASAKLSPSKSKDPFPNRNLQTLSTISPESTATALAKASNLKKLGIRGNLAKHLEHSQATKGGGSSFFKNLGEMMFIENLKLLNDGPNLQQLPSEYEFPPNLRKLTLSRTELKWSHLSVLGTLKCLRILKLVERAFTGEFWEPTNGGFLLLQVLHIERTDLKTWNASNQHFPSLKSLVLKHCTCLEEVPFALAKIDSLQEIEVNHSNRAIESAQKILAEKQQKQHSGRNTIRFKLTIYPPQNVA